MTSLKHIADFSCPASHHNADFVTSDTAALASHMSHCASTRSRFFGVHAVLESAHVLLFSRMVTAAVIAVVLIGVTGIV